MKTAGILNRINFCLNNLAEAELSMYSPYRYNDNWRVQLTGKTGEGDEIKLVANEPNLDDAITTIYYKVDNLVHQIPEFDANKSLPPPTPDLNDEIQF